MYSLHTVSVTGYRSYFFILQWFKVLLNAIYTSSTYNQWSAQEEMLWSLDRRGSNLYSLSLWGNATAAQGALRNTCHVASTMASYMHTGSPNVEGGRWKDLPGFHMSISHHNKAANINDKHVYRTNIVKYVIATFCIKYDLSNWSHN